MRAGADVSFEGRTWTVWSPGPRPGTWWLVRYDADGKAETVQARAAHLRSLQERHA